MIDSTSSVARASVCYGYVPKKKRSAAASTIVMSPNWIIPSHERAKIHGWLQIIRLYLLIREPITHCIKADNLPLMGRIDLLHEHLVTTAVIDFDFPVHE